VRLEAADWFVRPAAIQCGDLMRSVRIVAIGCLFAQDSREVSRLEQWIMEGAIIGMLIGSLLGLTGDSLINFIDSLIGRRPPAEAQRDHEQNRIVEEIEKNVMEEIESVVPIKRWGKEKREQEEKRSERCNDLFQEWNNLCGWFDKNWQRKVKLDEEMRNLHKTMIRFRQEATYERRRLYGRGFIRYTAYTFGLASVLMGQAEVGIGEHVSGLEGGYHLGHTTLTALEGRETIGVGRTHEGEQLDLLEKGEREIMKLRKLKMDQINDAVRGLKDEYLKNRDRLREIERLMRDSKCEGVFSAMGHPGIPHGCPSADTPQWRWVSSR